MRTFGHRKNATQRRRSRLKEAPRSQGAVRPAAAAGGQEEAGSRLPCVCRVSRHLDLGLWPLELREGRAAVSRGSAVQTRTLQFSVPEPRQHRGDPDAQLSLFSVTSGCSRSQTQDPCGRGQLSVLTLASGQRTQQGRFLPQAGITTFSPREPRGLQGGSAAAPDVLSRHFLSPLTPHPHPVPALKAPWLAILPIRRRHASLGNWSGLARARDPRAPLGPEEPSRPTRTALACETSPSQTLRDQSCGSPRCQILPPVRIWDGTRTLPGCQCLLRSPGAHRWGQL